MARVWGGVVVFEIGIHPIHVEISLECNEVFRPYYFARTLIISYFNGMSKLQYRDFNKYARQTLQ